MTLFNSRGNAIMLTAIMIFVLVSIAAYVVPKEYSTHTQPLPYVCVDKVKYYDFFRHGYAVAYDETGNIKLCGEANEASYVVE